MTNWFEDITCICGEELIPAYGYEDSKIMIIGGYPDEIDTKQGRPMVGRLGTVLKSELNWLGVHLENVRYGNLWLHAPNERNKINFDWKDGEITSIQYLPDGTEKVTYLDEHPISLYQACFEKSIVELMKELEGKEAILLLGKDPVEFFLNEKVTDVCGLFLPSHLYSGKMMACVNPAIVFQKDSVVGELRLALKKFVTYCMEHDLL